MKLFRFIKNVWNAIFDALFDGDLKSFAKHVAGTVVALSSFMAVSYGLGIVGKWLGLMVFMKEDNVIGLGAIILFFLFILLILVFVALNIITSLREIWNKS